MLHPARRNTAVAIDVLEDDLAAWARSRGPLGDGDADEAERRFRTARFGECAAYVYPDVPDPLVYAKWCAWLFIADDEFDENRAPAAGGIDRGVLRFPPPDGAAPATPTGR